MFRTLCEIHINIARLKGNDMTAQKIDASRVTKPIQLLAAWLIGLVLVDSAFLGAAVTITIQWIKAVLVIAAVLNVPVFLFALFLLQTRYRPEMQEDAFYSEYLDKRTRGMVNPEQVRMADSVNEQVLSEIQAIKGLLPANAVGMDAERVIERRRYSLSINDYLSQFEDLRSKLRAQGFWIKEIFGSTNPDPQVPRVYIISICDDVDLGYVRDVLRLLLKFPSFDGIKFHQRSPNFIDESDVYLGTYDFEKGYAVLTPELQTLVDEGFERVDIDHYCKTHWQISK